MGKIQLNSDEYIQELTNKIVDSFNPIRVYLFGSYAYGNPSPDSDIDLMIVMNSDLPRYKRSSAIHLKCFPYKIPLDILVYTPDEFEYWKDTINHIINEVDKKGKVLYERKS
jgi:uncharacterized protein